MSRLFFSKNSRLIVLVVIVFYGVLGLFAYWPILPWDTSRLPVCVCGDAVQSVWFLRWVPHAIANGNNPLYTNWINYPAGANLAQNTLMPLLGMITAPISILISPVMSFNLLAWLAFPLSASSMFFVVRRLTGSISISFLSGLLYGFSPYMVGQGVNHIMLSFMPLPPLIIWVVLEIVVTQKSNPLTLGMIFASLVVAQFLIEPEVLALTVIVIGLGIFVALFTHRKYFTRKRIEYSIRAFLITTVLSAILLAYPIWFMLLGPNHFSGPNFSANNPFRSDLFGLLAPTLNEKFVFGPFIKLASTTAAGNYPESGDYVGVVLLFVLAFGVFRWKKNRWIVLTAMVAFICWVLSLGPRLVINGVEKSVALPFQAIVHLPLLENIIPSRFAMAEWLIIPFLAALVLVEAKNEYHARSNILKNGYLRWLFRGLVFVLVLGVMIPLIPRWPNTAVETNVSSIFDRKSTLIPANSIVLAYPFPMYPSDEAMLWQASNSMRFKLVGGYIQNKSPQGAQTQFATILQPQSMQEWLSFQQGATNTPWPVVSTILADDIRSYLIANKIGSVVIDRNALNAELVAKSFKKVLGQPEQVDNLYVWSKVKL